jgi:biopolymer transport protein ExbD
VRLRDLAFLCLALTLAKAAEAAAPSVIYGKSVVVTTNEIRVSRPVGGGPEGATSAHNVLSIYISAMGRLFVRSHRTLTSNELGTVTKDIDTEPDGGPIGVSTSSDVQFTDTSMTINLTMSAGTRRITIIFDSPHATCTATVINEKEGDKPMVIRSRYTGEDLEILSIQTTVESCAIKTGNVFAGE